MEPVDRLIELYKRNLDIVANKIWCEQRYSASRLKSFDSDTILINFFNKETKKNMSGIFNHNGVKIQAYYILGENENQICLCKKNVNFYVDKEYKEVKINKDRSFLGYKYSSSTTIKEYSDEKTEYINYLTDKGFENIAHDNSSRFEFEKMYYFITFENLLFEINIDMFKELENFTLHAIEKRSTSNLINAK